MGLLERYRELPRPASELQSVVENLRHLLNTHAGFYPILRDLGLGDLTLARDATSALLQLSAEVLHNIRLYEPRFQVEALVAQGRSPDFWLRLELRGTLHGRPQRLLVRFHQIYGNCDVRAVHVE
jgi:predicted component of type VI protein secretion system